MLVRPDATFLDDATKQVARVFPTGSAWLTFESRLPGKEIWENSNKDPAIGLGGELALSTFANAEWQNWVSSTQVAVFELATRVGVPPIDNQPLGSALASIYNSIPATLASVRDLEDPLTAVPDLLKNMGLLVIQQLAGQQNAIAQVFAQVLAAAVWAIDVVASFRAEELQRYVSLPGLQTEDPGTDTWQVNRVFEVLRKPGRGDVQFPDGGLSLASNADYTPLYLPAYTSRKPWKYQWREGGIAAQQGDPQEGRGPAGDTQFKFDPGDGSTFGFMPGTGVMLRVLQASHRYYASLRGNAIDRYHLRCRGVDRGCLATLKAFDGSRDCRQCVTTESVWPVKGVAHAIGGVPLNVTTPGENVGEFYSATNQLLGGILDMISRPGPLLYTIDAQQVHDAWQRTFENFWEFMRAEWTHYHGWGWRGVLSRLATLMVVFDDGDTPRLGGRYLRMPSSLVANPREAASFEIGFEHSIFERVIKGYCADLYQLQRFYLHTTEVAYIPPGAGALYNSEGKLKVNQLAGEFAKARAELLGSTKRMLVDLRRVSDPEFRFALEKSGVKVSPINPKLQDSPGVEVLEPDDDPKRAPRKPKAIRVPLLSGANELVRAAPRRARLGDAPPRTTSSSSGSQAAAVGLAVLTGVAVGGGAALLASRAKDKPNDAE